MTDIKEFFKLYFPASKFRRARQNAIAFFAPDGDQAELDALQATIDDLERQRRIISQQLTIVRWELHRKKYIKGQVDLID
ncbi:MAG: hypothetical protein ING36_11525 [Burkholderiales bacterium]|jgi:hypothetical protein|uniref:hypothetical protein n=1 Tax=unclassified Microcystis TaxID=2643300 RepID=UPI0025831538|nr:MULTISPECIES: hypothetical protein [unclassified Microcystis]MCA2924956.1 hypothetical protein [Microcystis sp. M020S1]MCA3159317.1 hypothetical protein [Burkholderiales bacterium]MCA2910111.1 hypothetical protein [Microcystis sp. M034S1]MCA2954789.1 hypothetical protein [Microcystis sp. M010S1]MCA3160593.1 hypothetical protein [Burkholderiales bacterium]